MGLRDDIEMQGQWLFRWRSFLPLLLIFPCSLAMNDFQDWRHVHDGLDYWGLFCLGVSFFGLLIRAVTVGYVPHGTSGRNTKGGQIAETLNTTGVYSVVRHPLYVGNFWIWFGVSLFPMHWWLCTIFVLAFWLYYERIVIAEEAFLERKFGDTWCAWARATPTCIPRWRRWKWRQSRLSFSLRTVLRREYSALLGIVVGFFALELGAHVIADHGWIVHPVWTVILASGVIAWFVLRTLKKRTTLLAVAGR